MGLQETNIESLPFVTAELNYLAPTSEKPRTYAFDPPPGEPKTTNLPEPHRLPIFDARLIAGDLSLDREGFALVRHPTAVRNFHDEAEIKRVYYPAAEAFIRATLKADRVVIFDHTVRKRVEGAADLRGAGPRQPATRVHVDQTVIVAPDPRAAARRAARDVRRHDGRRRRSRRLRPDLSQPARRDLFGQIQSESSLVLYS